MFKYNFNENFKFRQQQAEREKMRAMEEAARSGKH